VQLWLSFKSGISTGSTGCCLLSPFRHYDPAIRSGRDNKFTVPFLCSVTDFSAEALPIGVKFLHGGLATSRTDFLPFWGDSCRDGRILGVNRGHTVGYVFFAEARVFCSSIASNIVTATLELTFHGLFLPKRKFSVILLSNFCAIDAP